MRPALRSGLLALSLFVLAACRANAPVATADHAMSLRFATFNASLYTEQAGGLLARLQAGDPDARKIAAVIQRQRPDVLLINEFDYDPEGAAAALFMRDYLGVGQHGQEAITYPYHYLAPVNTGEPSGLDLDLNGRVATQGRERGNDAWGYGLHPGQYGMLVLSRYPIDTDAARSFRLLRWAAMPGALAPRDPATGGPWYPEETWQQLRLSSKSHWDLPVLTPLGTVHLLAAHPTPPVFDGPERRNAARNHDEIRLWAEYVSPGEKPWLCDDRQRCGGLPEGERFVIAGDYNADPADGSSLPGTIQLLLEHPRVLRHATPRSEGAVAAVGGSAADADQHSSPAHDTAQFGPRSGNFRVDYVLPSVGFSVTGSGVFWPAPGQPGADWLDATDHRMVWVDLVNPHL
ncbi:endonuclease [Arenimonas soli]|uniref:Endonuclease n=2 Tax=Arenimonas soli TaxID=2269504 RepID=A0ABQ1HGZ5_9GAMM|nr:endonuclease/exonuclease/phosphatase family protein [Arenimonas soli]GGA77340.1 endonuclease [Arenimonas soli]